MITEPAPLVELSEFSHSAFRESLGRLVLCKGVYDLTHAGHVASLAAASTEGDRLAVALATDESVRMRKGPGRPVLTLKERITIVSNLKMVDMVTVYDEETPLSLLMQVKPAVYCATHLSWLKREERLALESLGIEFRVLPRPRFSSTTEVIQSIAQALTGGKGIST